MAKAKTKTAAQPAPAPPAPQTVKCAICSAEVNAAEYVAHVQQFHAAPVAAQPPPVPAAVIPAYQPPPGAPPYQPPPAAPPQQQNAPVTPPPPPMPRNPFINAQMVYANGGKFTATITAVRDASNVKSKKRPDIQPRKGWLIDLATPQPVRGFQDNNGTIIEVATQAVCGRINEGDMRHQTLWAKYGPNWVGRQVTIRLPLPTDNTKAEWLVE